MRILATALFVSFLISGVAVADSVMVDSNRVLPGSNSVTEKIGARYVVRIERVKVTDGELFDTLDVMLNSYGSPIGGFDLRIGTDSPYLEIMEVLKGEIPDSCDWEFFQARRLGDLGQSGVPSTLWKVTALAEFLPDSTDEEAPCHGLGRPASMIRLVVSSLHVDQVPDTAIPIYFFWQLCADNVLSSAEGNHMLVSKQVFDYYEVGLESERDIFPTRFGTPQQCINPSLTNGPVRAVEFHNGGVEFRLDIGIPADSTADSL